ncbi:MAG TPA: ABC transporter ATP-binding protein [Polyangia bacterium]|nr:ABC transporter ATP-binding protein [Polyangia bacterium]
MNLTLRSGEALALLGPNGAGKSTLVGILATLIPPSKGAVTYGGREPDDDTRRSIGVIAHESLCYGDLTGRENVRFFARLYGVERPAERADELLERVGLSAEASDRAARTYSRGMLQRLALARALVHRPRLLLADEPFTGLDRAGVELLGKLLAEERASGAMVLVVTHDFDAVAGVADRVVVLARGRVTRDAPAPPTGAGFAELYRAAAPDR